MHIDIVPVKTGKPGVGVPAWKAAGERGLVEELGEPVGDVPAWEAKGLGVLVEELGEPIGYVPPGRAEGVSGLVEERGGLAKVRFDLVPGLHELILSEVKGSVPELAGRTFTRMLPPFPDLEPIIPP